MVSSPSLNEGRGTHPGDTRVRFPACAASSRSAQRRPGHAPRRHNPTPDPCEHRHARSTKAGARTPATLLPPAVEPEDERRSTKAGARTPATQAGRRERGRRTCPLNEGRGTHPGDTRGPSRPRGPSGSLNEGRGTHPGDTRRRRSGPCRYRRSLNEGRGTHPGDTTPMVPACASGWRAQRRPGHAPRRHVDTGPESAPRLDRSTKAGARTPATPLTLPRKPLIALTALNEGRGTHPGDTPRGVPSSHVRSALNEGRGTHPGDTRR